MMYDVDKRYTAREFEVLSHNQLVELYKSAKAISSHPTSLKGAKKVRSDLTTMRQVLKGFNRNHNCRN